MFDKILAAVDPDELNAALVDQAIDLAATTGAEIKCSVMVVHNQADERENAQAAEAALEKVAV